MNLQQKTLRRYRHYFPHDSLREIALKTGINFTRVFRLFNQAPMKLHEFEKLQALIAEKENQGSRKSAFLKLLDEVLPLLSDQEIQFYTQILERKLFLNKIKFNEFSPETRVIA